MSVSSRYEVKCCRFLRQDVWAILVEQPDGAWRIANCLDKSTRCFETTCALVNEESGSQWPFKRAADSGDTGVVKRA